MSQPRMKNVLVTSFIGLSLHGQSYPTSGNKRKIDTRKWMVMSNLETNNCWLLYTRMAKFHYSTGQMNFRVVKKPTKEQFLICHQMLQRSYKCKLLIWMLLQAATASIKTHYYTSMRSVSLHITL